MKRVAIKCTARAIAIQNLFFIWFRMGIHFTVTPCFIEALYICHITLFSLYI